MVFVKPTMSSRATPSWPAASATAATSAWVVGRVVASPRSPPSSCAYPSVVSSTVFFTPVNADFQSMAAFADPPAAAISVAPTVASPEPTSCRSAEFLRSPSNTREVLPPVASISSPRRFAAVSASEIARTCSACAAAACRAVVSTSRCAFATRSSAVTRACTFPESRAESSWACAARSRPAALAALSCARVAFSWAVATRDAAFSAAWEAVSVAFPARSAACASFSVEAAAACMDAW